MKAIVIAACMSSPVSAEKLLAPTGDVLLTISGNVVGTNASGSAQFDLEMLEALEQTEFETTTIWTKGLQKFQGVSLAVLANAVGISGETLKATAINDYAVEIPLDHALEGDAIVAYRLNGETMSIRDKGPLWIVYPYDSDAEFRTEVVYSRSIWQLDRIEATD